MDYIENASAEIKKWENEKPGFLNQVADFILWPAEKAADALIPASIMDTVGKAIQGCLSGLASQTTRTFDAETIRTSVKARGRELGGEAPSLSDLLRSADERARESWNWHIGCAVTEGGATGAAGFVGLAVDIPALFTILIREIQEIAVSYGYDPDDQAEREYLLHVLRTGSATNIKEKIGFVVSLKEFEQILLKVAWKSMSEKLAAKQISKESLLAAIRQFAKSLEIQITKRKALQMIPSNGALVGASFNGVLANDIGHAAYMSYRRRWIADHSAPPSEDAVPA